MTAAVSGGDGGGGGGGGGGAAERWAARQPNCAMEELDATEHAIFERTASLIGRSSDADAIHALSQLSKPTLLHRTPSDCISLLHLCALRGLPRACRWLLAHGADPSRCDAFGLSPSPVGTPVCIYEKGSVCWGNLQARRGQAWVRGV